MARRIFSTTNLILLLTSSIVVAEDAVPQTTIAITMTVPPDATKENAERATAAALKARTAWDAAKENPATAADVLERTEAAATRADADAKRAIESVEQAEALLVLAEAEATHRPGINVVERRQIDLALHELILSQSKANDATKKLQLGKLATADLIVSIKLLKLTDRNERKAIIRVTEPLTGVIRGATIIQIDSGGVEEAAEQIIHYVNAVVHSPKTAGLTVSVGTFESEGKFDHVRPLELIVRDVVTEQLRHNGGFQVLQRTDMSGLLSELELVVSGLADTENLPDTLPSRAGLYHVHGTVNERIDDDNNIHMIVNAKLTQAITGKVVLSLRKEFVKSETAGNLRELTAQFVQTLKRSRSVPSSDVRPAFDEAQQLYDLAIRDARRFCRKSLTFGSYYVQILRSPLPKRPIVGVGSDLGRQLLRKTIDRLETVLFLQPDNGSAQFALAYCYSFHIAGTWNPTRCDHLFRQVIHADKKSGLASHSFRHLLAMNLHHLGGPGVADEHVPLFIRQLNYVLANAPHGIVSTSREVNLATDLLLKKGDFSGLLETTTIAWKRVEQEDHLHRSHRYNVREVAAALKKLLTNVKTPPDVKQKAQQLLDQWARHSDEQFRKSAFDNLPSLLQTEEQIEAKYLAYAARIMARQRPLEYVSPELLEAASYFLKSERPGRTVELLTQADTDKVWPENGVVHMSTTTRDYYRTLGQAYEDLNQPQKARDAYLSSSELKKSARIDPTTQRKIIELGGVPLKSDRDISIRHHDFAVAGQHAQRLATDGEQLFCGKLSYGGIPGIYVLDLRTKKWKDFKKVPHHVTCLVVNNGTLWAGTSDSGLWKVDVASGMTTQFSKANGLPADKVVSLAVAKDDVYARVVTSGVSVGGVVHINKDGVVHYLGDAKTKSTETNIAATDLMVANQKLLVTSKSHVYQWDEQKRSWTDFFNRIVPGKVFYDNGTFWNSQSSWKLHLAELKPKGRIYTRNSDEGTLSRTHFLFDRGDYLWFGGRPRDFFRSSGLCRVHKKTGEVKHYGPRDGFSIKSFADFTCHDAVFAQDRMWIAMSNGIAEVEILPAVEKPKLSPADKRHQLFLKTVENLELKSESKKRLWLNRTPLLRRTPSNISSVSAESFLLNDEDGIPRIIASTSLRQGGKLYLEVTSVSDESVYGSLPQKGKWRAKAGGSGRQLAKLQPEGDGVEPDDQLRAVADSISVELRTKQWTALKMRPQSFYRYHHESNRDGVTQGAIFSFGLVDGDPDAFLVVWQEPRSKKWYWLASAATSRPLRCNEGSQVIWNKPGYWSKPRTVKDNFVEVKLSEHPDLFHQNSGGHRPAKLTAPSGG